MRRVLIFLCFLSACGGGTTGTGLDSQLNPGAPSGVSSAPSASDFTIVTVMNEQGAPLPNIELEVTAANGERLAQLRTNNKGRIAVPNSRDGLPVSLLYHGTLVATVEQASTGIIVEMTSP